MMKISALLEMTLPRSTVDDDGNLLFIENSLFTGLSEEEYRAHGLQNRMILTLKQLIVPRSGNLTRQMGFLAQGLEYHPEYTDPKNIGIWLPQNLCEGRTTVDGKVLRKSSSKKLVKVRSVAVTGKDFICIDHISRTLFPPEETSKAFGLRAATSLTEQMTQAGLSLKHSGSFVQLPAKNSLVNATDIKGKVIKNEDSSTLDIIGTDLSVIAQYPLPKDFDILHDKVESRNDPIGTSLEIASAGLNLDIMIKILRARKVKADEGLAKNNVILGNGISPFAGIIIYDFDKGTFKIGDHDMGKIIDSAVYYFPNGYKVKKFDVINSLPIDMSWYINNKEVPLEDSYLVFRKGFKSYAGKNLTEELIEVMFHLITKKNFKTGEFEFLGVRQGVTKGNDSFFAQLSFEGAKKALSKLGSGELQFKGDMFTRNILDHMIISAGDNTQDL